MLIKDHITIETQSGEVFFEIMKLKNQTFKGMQVQSYKHESHPYEHYEVVLENQAPQTLPEFPEMLKAYLENRPSSVHLEESRQLAKIKKGLELLYAWNKKYTPGKSHNWDLANKIEKEKELQEAIEATKII